MILYRMEQNLPQISDWMKYRLLLLRSSLRMKRRRFPHQTQYQTLPSRNNQDRYLCQNFQNKFQIRG